MGTKKHKVYVNNYALTIEVGTVRSDSHIDVKHVVNFEFSKKLNGSDRYDWDNAITVQASGRELFDIIRCLNGWHGVEVKLNRPHKDNKTMVLTRNYESDSGDLHFLMQVRTNTMGTAMAVRFDAFDGMSISAIVFMSLLRNHGGLSQEVLMGFLKSNTRIGVGGGF